jgi:long-chain acyl-CoA synthetase
MNVGTLLSNATASHRSRVALRFDERSLDYVSLQEQANRLGSALRRRGLVRGDRVALYMRNNAEYVSALFGVLKAGMVVVPVNAKLSPDELAFILGDSGARALVFGEEKADVVEAALCEAPVDVVVHVGSAERGLRFEDLLVEGDPDADDADVDPADLAWLFYTSGTTGRPKGAQISHRNLMAMVMNLLADICAFRSDDVVLHAAPLSHGSGLYLLGAIARGATNVIFHGPSFDPNDVLRVVERQRVTVIAFLVPTMIVMLLEVDTPADTGSLRCVIYGGGPIHVEHAERMLRRFGKVFVQMYGMGEAPMTITYLDADSHDPDDPGTLASAGIRRTDVEVRLVDAEGRVVGDGVEGQVCVRGDVVISGYWRDPKATASALRDGWLHTGDIGRFDERGRLFLLDRTSDMIISGGTNIYPREVEEVLARHDDVQEVVVFGVPDARWGESVVAAVVPAPGRTPDTAQLLEFCRSRIASFKKPKRIIVVDAIPKNAYGKVMRREMRLQHGGAERAVPR